MRSCCACAQPWRRAMSARRRTKQSTGGCRPALTSCAWISDRLTSQVKSLVRHRVLHRPVVHRFGLSARSSLQAWSVLHHALKVLPACTYGRAVRSQVMYVAHARSQAQQESTRAADAEAQAVSLSAELAASRRERDAAQRISVRPCCTLSCSLQLPPSSVIVLCSQLCWCVATCHGQHPLDPNPRP